jgi:hypothetical protein
MPNFVTSRNLAERSSDGLRVSLNYDPDSREVWLFVSNVSGESFMLNEIPYPLALDVYHHPYAYAERLMQAGTYASRHPEFQLAER